MHGEFVVPFNHFAENSGSFIQRDNVQLIKQQKLTKLKKLPLIAALNLQIPPANFFLKKNNKKSGSRAEQNKCKMYKRSANFPCLPHAELWAHAAHA